MAPQANPSSGVLEPQGGGSGGVINPYQAGGRPWPTQASGCTGQLQKGSLSPTCEGWNSAKAGPETAPYRTPGAGCFVLPVSPRSLGPDRTVTALWCSPRDIQIPDTTHHRTFGNTYPSSGSCQVQSRNGSRRPSLEKH